MTTTSTTTVATTRAPRYGKQLVAHLGRRSVGVWDEATETGSLDMNDNTVHVAFSTSPDALHIEIRSAEGDIATYEGIVGRHLIRFGERDELRARWVRSDGTDGTSQG